VASLQAKHSRSCAIVRARAEEKAREGKEGGASQWTSFADATKAKGCTCTPLYYSHHRHNGKVVREIVGANRKEAQRALDALRGDVARKRYRRLEDIPFDTWADKWLAALSGKANTRRVYRWTIEPAKEVFGKTKVRDLTTGDVQRFLDHISAQHKRRHRRSKDEAVRDREVSPATLAKHLRQLGACLQAAVKAGYAERNPVRELHDSVRPKTNGKRKPAYYTDAELARLWAELAYRLVYLYLCKAAVLTGLRFGELAALEWSDVDLLNREIHVSRGYSSGIGTTSTKSGEPRTIDLTPQAADLFEEWFRESGGEGLVFQREDGGYLEPKYTTARVLYPALDRAGVPRVGERGRKRDFHSFRHSFARIALEHGAEIVWVKEQLGHSSITLTVDTYGGWARAAQKAQAEKLEAAFPV
jgi:integrase